MCVCVDVMVRGQKFKDILKEVATVEKMKTVSQKRKKDRFKHFKAYYSLYNIIHNKSKYPSSLRNAVVRFMTRKHLKGLNEAVEAALDATVDLHPDDVQMLGKLKSRLREFKDLKQHPDKQRQHLLKKEQKGGFLPFLIPIIAGMASTLVGEGIHAAVKAGQHSKRKKKH